MRAKSIKINCTKAEEQHNYGKKVGLTISCVVCLVVTIGILLDIYELDEMDEQSANAKAEEPYTWTQIAEKTIWKLFLLVLFWNIAFIASLAFYTFRLNSVPLKWLTILWVIVAHFIAGSGICAGAHRLWTHCSYKANLPLRILLMIGYSTAGIYPLYYWIRDHRTHHKYSDTNADPHNVNRGFFFAHLGWLFMRRHPECNRKVKDINMSDIEADPVVMFQKKYSRELILVFCYIIPAAIPVLLWDETILNAILTQWFIRHAITLNATCSVNSVAHLWGYRPYNRSITPVENQFISLVALGEGSHNYHHTFPWDYKTSEYPYFNFNTTTLLIDTMAKLGWAYDLRQASSELIDKVVRHIGQN